jgi:hypothetical protein
MNKKELHSFHALYTAVHRAHKEVPAIWTDHECNRILTSVMAAKPFSWRVIGITAAALKTFAEMDFRYKSNLGLTRAHLRPRIETVRVLLATDEPLSEQKFIDTWLQNDRTILCARGENKASIPEYIQIDNEDGSLFSCEGRLAGWRHGMSERAFLRELFKISGHPSSPASVHPRVAQRERVSQMVIRKSVGTAWNKGKTMTFHGVEVGGTRYYSAWDAWQSLKIGTDSQCRTFRKKLKRTPDGTDTYTSLATNKKYHFKLIPREQVVN